MFLGRIAKLFLQEEKIVGQQTGLEWLHGSATELILEVVQLNQEAMSRYTRLVPKPEKKQRYASKLKERDD